MPEAIMKLRYLLASICFILCALIMPRSAEAAPPLQDGALQIAGAPLSIYVGSNGSIQVYHQNYTQGATFGTGDSGFFLALGSSVYGPNPSIVAVSTQMTAVSHTGPTGIGSASDPYRITTVQRVDAGGTNLL